MLTEAPNNHFYLCLKKNDFKRMNILCTISPVPRVNLNPEAMYLKGAYAGEFYAYGGLDYSPIFIHNYFLVS